MYKRQGVDSGLANINTTFTCAGAYGVAKETYHCAGHKAHGTITLAEALRQSCNIYYICLLYTSVGAVHQRHVEELRVLYQLVQRGGGACTAGRAAAVSYTHLPQHHRKVMS